jgi:hypothetical protein
LEKFIEKMCSCRKADLEKAPALCIELIEQSRGLSDSVYSIHCTTSLIAKLTSKNYNYVPLLILNVTFFFALSKNIANTYPRDFA